MRLPSRWPPDGPVSALAQTFSEFDREPLRGIMVRNHPLNLDLAFSTY